MKKTRRVAFFLIVAVLLASPSGGQAEESSLAKARVSEQGSVEEDQAIRLTPDTTKIVHLQEDAASVIVANPQHASIMLDNPRLLVIMPRMPGTTSFTVLNHKGQTILEKSVIVAGTVKPQYVRIRRACAPTDSSCLPNSYYYCPDGCYEVNPVGVDTQNPTPIPPLPPSSSSSMQDEVEPAAVAPPVPPPSEAGGGPQVNPAHPFVKEGKVE